MKSVVDARNVVVCAQCEIQWYVDDEAAKCTAPDHDHQQFDLHLHRSVVVLPDRTEVIAVSFDARDPYAREQAPDSVSTSTRSGILRGLTITSNGRISVCAVIPP
jgi:hypothetical protein